MKDSANHYSILIIDDDSYTRDLLSKILKWHKKLGASTGLEGFNKFKQICPDIVFLDIDLIDTNGLNLLEDMIAYDPEIFVVMLTKSAFAKDVEKAKELGAIAYVTKPFSVTEIEHCIKKYEHFRKVLDQSSPIERAEALIKKLKIDVEQKYANETLPEKEINAENSLQLTETHAEPAKTKHLSEEEQELRNWKVLFVDDYHTNRQRACEHFTQEKIGIIDVAANTKEAIEKAKATPYDTIFMDTDIDGESGYKVVEQIRELEKKHHPSSAASIVGMFETFDETESKEWLKCGMNDYVLKPASFYQLFSLVEKHIKHRIFLKRKVS